MNAATCNDTPDNHAATRDARFDMRLTEKFDDDDASSAGWTWVAAILIGGVLIVSGYLDQESANDAGTTATAVGQRYAANTSAPQAALAGATRTERRADKGY